MLRAPATLALGAVLLTAAPALATVPSRTAPGPTPTPIPLAHARPGRGLVVPRGAAPLPKIPFRGWLVADADTGAVLGAQEATVRHLPASTLKVLTALALLPHLSPNRLVTIPAAAEAVDGTKVGYTVGMRYSVRELATGMLIASGNDAARTLSAVAGGDRATIAAMKRVAADLGATDTVPGDPAGLDAPGETTTPYDLALIARAALRTTSISPYFLVTKATVRAPHGRTFQIQNHNSLLGAYPGTIGVKNGYTIKARTTYVGAAHRYGHTLIVTLMSGDAAFAPSAKALLNWGFATEARSLAPVGRLVDPGEEEAAATPTATPAPTPTATARLGARSAARSAAAVPPRAAGADTRTRWERLTVADQAGGAAIIVVVLGGVALAVRDRRRHHPRPGR